MGLTIQLVILLIACIPVIINAHIEQNYKNQISRLKNELLNNESLFNDVVDAVKEINIEDDFLVKYDDTNNVSILSGRKYIEIDEEQMISIKEKYLLLKSEPKYISSSEKKNVISFSYTSRNGLNSYMQIYLIHFDNMSEEINGSEILSSHWALKIRGLV